MISLWTRSRLLRITELARAGRVPLIVEAIRLLKKKAGDQVAIGAWSLGPHLILGQVSDVGNLARTMFKQPDMVDKLRDQTAKMVIQLAKIYREAGADYFTVREMGVGTDILGPSLFKRVAQPHLKQVFSATDRNRLSKKFRNGVL